MLVSGVPHLVYHLVRRDGLSPGDLAASLTGLAAIAVIPIALLWVEMRSPAAIDSSEPIVASWWCTTGGRHFARPRGADEVIDATAAVGRMLGLAMESPRAVGVLDDLIDAGSGPELVECGVDDLDTGSTLVAQFPVVTIRSRVAQPRSGWRRRSSSTRRTSFGLLTIDRIATRSATAE